MAVMMHVVKGQAGVLDYNVSIPYEAWMSGGDLKLYLDQSKIGYHKSLLSGPHSAAYGGRGCERVGGSERGERGAAHGGGRTAGACRRRRRAYCG